ncbi:MAG: imidazolonepropionase [Candidatus Mcinerneyibacterium aminivorans]|uniref:Imidazolonepropionase n=1 Tax=Candidatus Mcinerneyibacterium aminivorans TaxID=2703815 RepID=A0A5D0MHN3_9BACT|nr:MAG: imidazolonepropionase [Candidatus Mcinerneyibacterium aminivorans]
MEKCSLLLKNCMEIISPKNKCARGKARKKINMWKNTDIAINNDTIADIGKNLDYRPDKVIDASNYVVMPGFVDSHTHLVFGGSRDEEYLMRVRGESYEKIAEQGGGIKSTVDKTRKLGENELFDLAENRLRKLLSYGTTTVEVKSGYGLDLKTEMKMLHVIKRLQEKYPETVISTFMGPHEIPGKYSEREYMDYVCNEMMPEVKKENLAEFVDIFTEKGVFSIDETKKYFEEAKKMGFKLKIHADELHPLGGAELAAEYNAISADHLMEITEKGIERLGKSNTVATLLPGTSFFLMKNNYAPARKLLDNNVIVALSTDYNPGSSNTYNMQMIINLASLYLKMDIEEIINAVGVNAAKAVDRSDRGIIKKDKKADLILLDIPNYKYLVYQYGLNNVKMVIKNGEKVVENRTDYLFGES